MVQEWKMIQEVYHRLNPDHDDDLKSIPYTIVPKELVMEHALEYLYNPDKKYVYPSKSYIVAIVYANYISNRWPQLNMYELLDDSNLLYSNDPYFVPYSEDPYTYDLLIEQYDKDINGGMLPEIRQWAKKEFMDDKA